MTRRITFVFFVLLTGLLLTACGNSAETINTAVEQTLEAQEPEVVETEVEVTRVVETEVEVTRVVETEVEVTRVVEVVVTATPEPTEEPTAVPTEAPTQVPTSAPTIVAATVAPTAETDDAAADPAPTPVPTEAAAEAAPPVAEGSVDEQIVAYVLTSESMLDYYHSMVSSGSINCFDEVAIYDFMGAPPQFDLTSASAESQNAYHQTVAGGQALTSGAFDLHTHCVDYLADPDTSSQAVTRDKYSFALAAAAEAKQIIKNAMGALGM